MSVETPRKVVAMFKQISLCMLPALLVGCAPDSGRNHESDTSAIEVSRQALTGGYVAPSVFNHSGLRHAADSTGVIVDHTRDGRRIKTYFANHAELGDADNCDGPGGITGACMPLHIQTMEKLNVAGKTLFRVWAKSASNDGWIESDDVAPKGPLTEEPRARAGNGESCYSHGVSLLTDDSDLPVKYVVTPKAITAPSGSRRWRLDSSGDAWYKFSPDWDNPAGPDRAFLFWSWTPTNEYGLNTTDFAGGGVVRTEMGAGDTFTPCKVEPIPTVLRAGAEDSTAKPTLDRAYLMTVFGAYGEFRSGSHSFYGWTIIASVDPSGACKMHVRCDGGSAKCPKLPLLPASCRF